MGATSLNKIRWALAVALLFAGIQKGKAFTLQFDYSFDSSSFFAPGTDARDRLVEAGAFFESVIGDDLDTIAPSGSNSWTTTFTNPGTGGPGFVSNPTIPADTLIVYVGAHDLGGSTLGEAGPGGWSGSGNAAWFNTIRQRGEVGSTQSPGATDFAPWGGSVTMDSDTVWDYSADGSTLDPGENHFYSVLLHEIAHVLGFGTSNSWDDMINASNEFIGGASVAEYGGNVPLQPTTGHWIADTDPGPPVVPIMSNIWGTTTSQEVAMDPNITVGTVKLFTDLDVAALEDIGWEIIPVPEPGVSALIALATPLLLRRRRRQPVRAD